MLTKSGWFIVVLTAACFAVGILLNYRELVMLGTGFLVCLLFAGVWLALRPRVEVHREVVPARVSEGEGSAGVLSIRNVAHRRSPPITALEAFAGGSLSVPLPGISGGATYTGSYLLPANRRGCFAVGPLRISHADPLKLVSFTQSYGSQATLWVHPRIHRMSPVPTGRTQELEGPTSAGAPSGGIAFHSLREYVPGDDLRQIHWRSTARMDKLMVRHTVITNEPKIMVLLDTSADPYDDDSFEDAVRIAASLVVACVDHRYPTEFRTTGGMTASVDPTGAGRTDVLDKLASIERSSSDPGLSAIVKMAARREQGVSLGAVTGQPDREAAGALGAVRGRFQMVTLVQLGEKLGRPGLSVSGVLSVSGETSEDLVRVWKRRVGG
jgi:uncharacterized protein (DUF58 family)